MILVKEKFKRDYVDEKWSFDTGIVLNKNYSLEKFHQVVNKKNFINQHLIGKYRVLNKEKNKYYIYNLTNMTVIKVISESEYNKNKNMYS